MFAGAEFAAGTIVAFQNMIFPLPQELLNAMEKLLRAGADQPLWLILLISAVLPAICEEMTFRGVAMSGFLTRMKPATAMALTGALFAAFHLSLHRFFPIFLLGWGLAYLVWKSGSIYTGMLLHLLNNGFAGIVVNYPKIDRFGLLDMKPNYVNLAVGITIIALSLYVSGLRFGKTSAAKE
jgi:membrane protease YdiL (CAAX protease family)